MPPETKKISGRLRLPGPTALQLHPPLRSWVARAVSEPKPPCHTVLENALISLAKHGVLDVDVTNRHVVSHLMALPMDVPSSKV